MESVEIEKRAGVLSVALFLLFYFSQLCIHIIYICIYVCMCVCVYIYIWFYLFIFQEGKGGRKRGRETSMCGCLMDTPPLGTLPTTPACALTGNWTCGPLVHRLMLNPLSHTNQGHIIYFSVKLKRKRTKKKWTLNVKLENQGWSSPSDPSS